MSGPQIALENEFDLTLRPSTNQFLLAIVLVMTGPKRSDKKGKDSGASSAPTPKAPEPPKK